MGSALWEERRLLKDSAVLLLLIHSKSFRPRPKVNIHAIKINNRVDYTFKILLHRISGKMWAWSYE